MKNYYEKINAALDYMEKRVDDRKFAVPLTLEAAEAGAQVTFLNNAERPVYYALNGGERIAIQSADEKTVTLEAVGDTVAFYGDNKSYVRDVWNGDECETRYSNIACSAPCYLYGNIMSLVSSENFEREKALEGDFTFASLFKNNANVKSKKDMPLLLPATALTDSCYKFMFCGCSGLTVAPRLPAEKLAEACYSNMFRGCKSLQSAPALPATELKMWCYSQMFLNCESLAYPPKLPAKKFAEGCCARMFVGCASLAYKPQVPQEMVNPFTFYESMFDGFKTARTKNPYDSIDLYISSDDAGGKDYGYGERYEYGIIEPGTVVNGADGKDYGYGERYEYGVIDQGSVANGAAIVFIKPGLGGTVFGHQNKYLEIAKALNRKFHCPVICSANKDSEGLSGDMKFVSDYAMSMGLEDWSVYYFGHSNGALRGLQEARKFPKIQRALLVNPPLMMDLHKSILGAKEFSGQSMRLVVGSKDPSADIASQFSELNGERFAVEILDGIDHNFTDAQDVFAALPEKYLFDA